jgi:hypothetical protein
LRREAVRCDPETNQLGGRINANFKPNSSDWQLIGGVADDIVERLTSRRVVWLRNHFSLPNDLATLVAEIHIGQRGGQS